MAAVAAGLLAVLVAPTPPAGAVSSVGAVGYDISFPQCGGTYPSGQAFGVVGVNDGRPDTSNPCLGPTTSSGYSGSELYWAVSTSTGSTTMPPASVYVNTADPGNLLTGKLVPDWPMSGSTPDGPCTPAPVTTSTGPKTAGENSPACAWEYGDQQAAHDASTLQAAAEAVDAQSPPVPVPTTPSAYPWWLDVEFANSWQTGPAGMAMNVAALQGFVDGLTAAGAKSVGVYSTSYMWGVITGGTSSSTPSIGRLPTWIPGASNEAGALTTCAGPSFTAGPVAVAQFPSNGFDGDLPCAQLLVTRIYGQTADATAAAEFTRAFPFSKGTCPATRAAVIATTSAFPDALSSQSLARHLTTGTLLTPTTALSPVTATTLGEEGIDTVYIVGGPLAVSNTVASTIANMTSEGCGGTPSTSGKIVVHRIFGETQYGTAEAVAETVGTAANASFPGAYTGTNATGGTGAYNDTPGLGSTTAPASAVPTAILASGEEFQDAQAASVISYHTALPMLLTAATTLSTTAVAAIRKLHVRQVILLGGPLAVTDSVVRALVAATGVSVLRVAGRDYTDTAAQLARFEIAGSANGLGWTPGHRLMIARGNGFTDGLSGAVLESARNNATGAAGNARPLLLTENPADVGVYLTALLQAAGRTGIDGTSSATVMALTILGGQLAVTTTSVAAMQTALGR